MGLVMCFDDASIDNTNCLFCNGGLFEKYCD